MVLRALKSTKQWGVVGESAGGPVILSYSVTLTTCPARIQQSERSNGNVLGETRI